MDSDCVYIVKKYEKKHLRLLKLGYAMLHFQLQLGF